MIDKLEDIKRRYEDTELKLSDPKIINDMKQFKKLNIEFREMGKIMDVYKVYKKVLDDIESAKELLATEKPWHLKAEFINKIEKLSSSHEYNQLLIQKPRLEKININLLLLI